jgi:hypothetical protein
MWSDSPRMTEDGALRECLEEIQRTEKRLKAFRDVGKNSSGRRPVPCSERAAAKRATLDLSAALARFRQTDTYL